MDGGQRAQPLQAQEDTLRLRLAPGPAQLLADPVPADGLQELFLRRPAGKVGDDVDRVHPEPVGVGLAVRRARPLIADARRALAVVRASGEVGIVGDTFSERHCAHGNVVEHPMVPDPPGHRHGVGIVHDEGERDSTGRESLPLKRRRDVLVDGLWKAGWQVPRPHATFYVWARVPAGGGDSGSFARKVLEEAHVVITPGVGFGPSGEGYVRMSLTAPEDRIAEAVDRFTRIL